MELITMNFSSGIFWAFMVVAFGVGYLVSVMFTRNRFKGELEKCLLEKSMILNNVNDDSGFKSEDNNIKAVQTRGRSGMAVKATEVKISEKRILKAKLNFEKIGEATPDKSNDLKLIDGIGPFIEEKLNEIGIYTYKQLSRLENDDINTITALLEFFPGRIERDDWLGQAAKLARKYPIAEDV